MVIFPKNRPIYEFQNGNLIIVTQKSDTTNENSE